MAQIKPSNDTTEPDLSFINNLSEKSKIGLGFSKRDHQIKEEEENGSIEYVIVNNDRSHESMRFLIDLKNIFSKQLPKMPKEYIARLMFNPNHQCLMILKNKEKIVGGICYRVFSEQNFAEVVFLAISQTEQIKGYGTRLMTKYKDLMQKEKIIALLTYADNSAIGYFKKQGFYKEIQFSEDFWKGRVKEYDGGTFMECKINQTIDYNKIAKHIAKQKMFVIEAIKKICLNHMKFPGIDKKCFPIEDLSEIESMRLAGLDPAESTVDIEPSEKDPYENFAMQCHNIVSILRKDKNSWPFCEPVDSHLVPDYYDIIKNPIDLKTIEQRITNDYYGNIKGEFVADVRLIFENAKIYNQKQTIYYKTAVELSNMIEPYLLEFLKRTF